VILAELSGVTKRFGAITALDRVTLALREGEVTALLGPNGAGKSTALAVLLGLRTPDDGKARLSGRDPRDPAARRTVGVVPQETAFPPTLRVVELLDLVRRHYAHPATVDALADRFGLASLLRRALGGLSGGERRLVAVALAFAGGPRLAVLDEPTTGLDVEARARVWSAVRAHERDGGSVLLTTHHLEEAEALAGRVVLLETGAVVEEGTVAEIRRSAGLTRVSFRAAPGFALEGTVREGDELHADVHDAGAFVASLVRRGVRLDELEVRPLTLEEALAARRRCT
jgi:ABC-2 type transport system ATP-binding protein